MGEGVSNGGPRFSAEVLNAVDGTPVVDATVIVAMDRPDGTHAGQIKLDRNLAVPGVYEAIVSVAAVGQWHWAADVSSPKGDFVLEGTLNVVAAPSAGLRGTLGWLGMWVALAVIIGLAHRSLRPPKKALTRGG